MKRQFFTLGLAVVSAIGGLAMMQPAQAQSIFNDTEPNDTSTGTIVPLHSNQVASVSGSISSSDTQDRYRFTTQNGVNSLTIDMNASNLVRLIMFEDKNGNGKVDRGDTTVTNIGLARGQERLQVAPNKSYLLVLTNGVVVNGLTISYQMSLRGS
jgi:uncharacterized protein YdeI (BOF family)